MLINIKHSGKFAELNKCTSNILDCNESKVYDEIKIFLNSIIP